MLFIFVNKNYRFQVSRWYLLCDSSSHVRSTIARRAILRLEHSIQLICDLMLDFWYIFSVARVRANNSGKGVIACDSHFLCYSSRRWNNARDDRTELLLSQRGVERKVSVMITELLMAWHATCALSIWLYLTLELFIWSPKTPNKK